MESYSYLSLVFLCVVPIPYFLLILTYYFHRFDPFFKPRFPLFFVATNVYLLLCCLILPLQELLISSVGPGSFPCWIIHSLSAFWPFFLFLHCVRSLLLILLYDLEFRRSSRFAFLLKRASRRLTLLLGSASGFLLSALLIGVHSDSHTAASSAQEMCFYLEDSYFFLALAFSLSIPLVSITIRMRRVKDFLSAGKESEQVHWIHFIGVSIYIFSDLFPEWISTRRSNLVYRGTYLHWLFVFHSLIYAIRSLLIPLLQLRNRNSSKSGPNKNGRYHSEDSEEQAALDQLALGTRMPSPKKDNSSSRERLKKNGNDSFDTKLTQFQPGSDRLAIDLNYVIEHLDLLALFETHAQRSFCSESVLFLKAATPLLRQAKFLDSYRVTMASSSGEEETSNAAAVTLVNSRNYSENPQSVSPNAFKSSLQLITSTTTPSLANNRVVPVQVSPTQTFKKIADNKFVTPQNQSSGLIAVDPALPVAPAEFQPLLWFDEFVSIYESFIRVDSRFELNLSARLRREFKNAIAIHKQMQKANPTPAAAAATNAAHRMRANTNSFFDGWNFKLRVSSDAKSNQQTRPAASAELIAPIQTPPPIVTQLSSKPAISIPNALDEENSDFLADSLDNCTAAATPDLHAGDARKSRSQQAEAFDSGKVRPDLRFAARLDQSTVKTLAMLYSLLRSCHQEVSSLLQANLLGHFLQSEDFIAWQKQQQKLIENKKLLESQQQIQSDATPQPMTNTAANNEPIQVINENELNRPGSVDLPQTPIEEEYIS